MDSLKLDQRVDFEEGDIGLAGGAALKKRLRKGLDMAFRSRFGSSSAGIKDFEPALAHPVAKDQIIRFGGRTEGHLPWPEKLPQEAATVERTIQRTIQRSLAKIFKGGKVASEDASSSHHSSGKDAD